MQQIDEGEITFGKTYDLSTKQNAVALPMENSKFTKFNQEIYDNIYQKLANDEIKLFNHSDVTDVTNIPLQKIIVQSIK